MSINEVTQTVGQLVAERPARARVFERFGIDYCCGGKKALHEACAARGLDTARVQAEIERCDSDSVADDDGVWLTAPLGDLADHIETVHHGDPWEELPRLQTLMDRVKKAHGAKYPELDELERVFLEFKLEMEIHMRKEERVLFPLIKRLEGSIEPLVSPCSSILNPISVMEMEHERASAGLTRMRELTSDFTPPTDTCATHRVLLNALATLEVDTHRHVHKENNSLFPRALAWE